MSPSPSQIGSANGGSNSNSWFIYYLETFSSHFSICGCSNVMLNLTRNIEKDYQFGLLIGFIISSPLVPNLCWFGDADNNILKIFKLELSLDFGFPSYIIVTSQQLRVSKHYFWSMLSHVTRCGTYLSQKKISPLLLNDLQGWWHRHHRCSYFRHVQIKGII